MVLRVSKLQEETQFLETVKSQVWGSKKNRFSGWRPGDTLMIIVGNDVAGIAEVIGVPYRSEDVVWDNGVFPYRIPLQFKVAFLPENRPPVLGTVRDGLVEAWGPNWGLSILNQQSIAGELAGKIESSVSAVGSGDLKAMVADVDRLLVEARLQRDIAKPKKRAAQSVREISVPGVEDEETPEQASTHTKAQSELVRLGRATGCTVWVATNDRNRTFRGKPIGEDCLSSLPGLGLNQEATTKISYIDVIWLRQGVPICAFEVESTTSVYSGMLRMSDLLALVPALKLKLFIVAPKERQGKVMGELARPTFRKIGLSDFCKFVSTESLTDLVERVEGFRGYLNPGIIETISVQLEGEPKEE